MYQWLDRGTYQALQHYFSDSDLKLSTTGTLVANDMSAKITKSGDTTAKIRVGWRVVGTYIPAGTTVLSITDTDDFELSKPATASGTVQTMDFYSNYYFEDDSCDTTSGDATMTMTNTALLAVDMYVSGYGIPYGAQIDSITSGTQAELTMSAEETLTNTNFVFSMLTEEELNCYYAEVEFARYEFLEMHARKKLYHRKAESESISEGGITHSTSGVIGVKMSSREFLDRAKLYISRAGLDINTRVMRGNSYFWETQRQ
jgi:hypothetical protein